MVDLSSSGMLGKKKSENKLSMELRQREKAALSASALLLAGVING